MAVWPGDAGSQSAQNALPRGPSALADGRLLFLGESPSVGCWEWGLLPARPGALWGQRSSLRVTQPRSVVCLGNSVGTKCSLCFPGPRAEGPEHSPAVHSAQTSDHAHGKRLLLDYFSECKGSFKMARITSSRFCF